jgi:hypothetical protein
MLEFTITDVTEKGKKTIEEKKEGFSQQKNW